MAQTSEALNGDMQCPNAERLAEQWFNEHESRRKEKEESLNFLLHMYRQDEEAMAGSNMSPGWSLP